MVAFLKVTTNLVNLLFIELMLNLSNVKQMYSQPIHLTHELILCLLITSGRVDFKGCSKALLAPSFELVTFRPRCTLLWGCTFITVFGIFMAPHGQAHSSGQYSGGPLCIDNQFIPAQKIEVLPAIPNLCIAEKCHSIETVMVKIAFVKTLT